MSAPNIDVNELIGLLNSQIAGQNLELHIAKLQVSGLQKEVEELSKKLEKASLGNTSGDTTTRSKTR